MPILPLPNSRSARQADLSLATSGGVAPSGAVAHPFFFPVSWRSQPWWRKRC